MPPLHEDDLEEERAWFLDHFSLGELRLCARRGTAAVRRRALLLQWASLALLVVAGAGLANEISLFEEPGIVAVLYVVACGVALASFCFHLIRWRAARRLAAVPTAAIAAHLRANELLKSGGLEAALPAA